MQQRYPSSPGPSPQDDDDDVQVSENGIDPLDPGLLPSIRKSGGGCGRHFFSMKNLHTGVYGLVR